MKVKFRSLTKDVKYHKIDVPAPAVTPSNPPITAGDSFYIVSGNSGIFIFSKTPIQSGLIKNIEIAFNNINSEFGMPVAFIEYTDMFVTQELHDIYQIPRHEWNRIPESHNLFAVNKFYIESVNPDAEIIPQNPNLLVSQSVLNNLSDVIVATSPLISQPLLHVAV